MTSRGLGSLDIFGETISHVQRFFRPRVKSDTRCVEEGDIGLRDAGGRRVEHVIDERGEAQLDEEGHETSVKIGEYREAEGARAERTQGR